MKGIKSSNKLKVKHWNQVKSSNKPTIVRGNQVIRSTKININNVDKPKNRMINENNLKDKLGGTNFEDYNLDLMKLK